MRQADWAPQQAVHLHLVLRHLWQQPLQLAPRSLGAPHCLLPPPPLPLAAPLLPVPPPQLLPPLPASPAINYHSISEMHMPAKPYGCGQLTVAVTLPLAPYQQPTEYGRY